MEAAAVSRRLGRPASAAARAAAARRAQPDVDEGERRFVLVSGHGLGYRIESFPTEAEARAAFIAARLRTSPRAEWAELVAIDGEARLKRLSWFGTGTGTGAGAARASAPRVVALAAPAPRWRRRRRSSP